MKRFIPRRLRRHPEEEPPFDYSHQHKIPGPWPIVVLALMMLIIIYLLGIVVGQQAKLAEHDRQMTEYLNGRGEFRSAEAEKTRELLCAVIPKLQADDSGVLERYARDLECPEGPSLAAEGDEIAALPTPIDGAQPNSTGLPGSGALSERGSASGATAPRTGPPGASPSSPAPAPDTSADRGSVQPGTEGAAPTATPPASPPSTEPPEPEDPGGSILNLCLLGLACLNL